MNNVENFTGGEPAFSTVCWSESKLVRVVNKVFVIGLKAGLVVVVRPGLETAEVVVDCRGLDAGVLVVVDRGLEAGLLVLVDRGLEVGLVIVVSRVEDLVSAIVGVAALKLIVVLFLFLGLFFLFA